LTTFTIATNEFRGGGGERTEYHPCVAWDRLAEVCGQFLSKGQLVDVEGRLQTRQWDDDAGKPVRSSQHLHRLLLALPSYARCPADRVTATLPHARELRGCGRNAYIRGRLDLHYLLVSKPRQRHPLLSLQTAQTLSG
jgi:Single-strand binding protein family